MLEMEMIINDERIMKYAIEIFDEHPTYGGFGEKVVKWVFSSYPQNTTIESVFLKVYFLNKYYKTYIMSEKSLIIIAETIKLMSDLDDRLRKGCISAVGSIREIHKSISSKRTIKGFYSFATKYCCLHNQKAYPIYDRYVRNLLLKLNRKFKWDKKLTGEEIDKDYSKYKQLIDLFRNKLGMDNIDNYDYRTIDKGLYMLAWYYEPSKKDKLYGGDPWVRGKVDCFSIANGIE